MRTKLVAIGNSKGVRLPKAILQAAGLDDALDLHVEHGKVIITAARPTPRRRRRPRAGWEQAIQDDIAKNGPIETVDPDWELLPNTWDEEGWKW